MFRAAVALLALTVCATVASAQPRQLPLAPGVMPASPYGPGMPFLPPTSPLFPPPVTSVNPGLPVFFPGFPVYNPGIAFGYPFGSPLGYPIGTVGLPPVTFEPVIPTPAETVVLARVYPATLTLQFPAEAEVWLDGKKVSDTKKEEQVLTSPPLRMGEQHTFDVKARWIQKGKTFEAKRSVTVNPGDRSRLSIISGNEVRE